MSDFTDKDRWINLSLVHEREVYDLQGKIADLGAQNERLREACVRNQNVIAELFDRCSTLKGDNERLRKAGDALADLIWWEDPVYSDIMKVTQGWKAAKEGAAK